MLNFQVKLFLLNLFSKKKKKEIKYLKFNLTFLLFLIIFLNIDNH